MEILRSNQASARLPCPADNYLAITTRLLTLTDHPGLDLIIVLNRVSDRADGCHSPSGLVMEIPRFHERLRIRMNAVGRCRFRNFPRAQAGCSIGLVELTGVPPIGYSVRGQECGAASRHFETRAKIDPIPAIGGIRALDRSGAPGDGYDSD